MPQHQRLVKLGSELPAVQLPCVKRAWAIIEMTDTLTIQLIPNMPNSVVASRQPHFFVFAAECTFLSDLYITKIRSRFCEIEIERLTVPKPMGYRACMDSNGHFCLQGGGTLRFPVIPAQQWGVKCHLSNHPSLPGYNSPKNRVSGTRLASPQDPFRSFTTPICQHRPSPSWITQALCIGVKVHPPYGPGS